MGRTAARLQWLTLGLLALGLGGLSPGQVLGALTIGLTLLTALKLWEARRLEERRLVALLELVVAGLQAALLPELGPSLLQGTAMLTALAGLLALEVGEGPDLRSLLRRSLAVLAAALPIALVLLLLLPRLGPFAALPNLAGGAALTGLNDSLDPGGIAALAEDGAPAARVSFSQGGPPPAAERYWRVLVHDRFDGRNWQAAPGARPGSVAAAATEAQPAPMADGALQELWLAEPSGLITVPWSGSGQPLGEALRLDGRGELRLRQPSGQRRLYGIGAGVPGAEPLWRRQPPRPLDLQQAPGRNPRLEALARQWGQVPTPEQRLAAAERWFRANGFRYDLRPGRLPDQAPLDVFLFERRQGFCGHYASAFTALMRGAGVPARVVSGYRGGSWVPGLGGGGYLDLRRSDAHAWSEVWLPGEGWRRVDPSAWVVNPGAGVAAAPTAGLGWLQRQWWALDLAWSRWWLGFDQRAQDALLQRLLGNQRGLVGLLILGLVALGLAAGLGWLAWLGRRRGADPLRRELERSLAMLARHGITPLPGETLPRLLARAGQRWPELAAELAALAADYQRARFGRGAGPGQGPGAFAAAATARRQLRRRRQGLERRLGPRAGWGWKRQDAAGPGAAAPTPTGLGTGRSTSE